MMVSDDVEQLEHRKSLRRKPKSPSTGRITLSDLLVESGAHERSPALAPANTPANTELNKLLNTLMRTQQSEALTLRSGATGAAASSGSASAAGNRCRRSVHHLSASTPRAERRRRRSFFKCKPTFSYYSEGKGDAKRG